ncbi:uncharacterized protein LOC103999484 isoform X2 [Musa acuminata AAA Group]|uniref:uncharacterized protein LOC103999484 isoform X2 n=1 Tax=Musa acuminata AAA Group TaxID=214697 RepID=UPI0031E31A11
MESGGGGRPGFMEIEAAAADGLGRSDIFHIVKEILGFVLYMHQQIPSLLQHLENEFDALKEEHESLEEACRTPEESKASDRRKHNLRKREIKQGIRRLDKLMCSKSSLLSAFRLALEEMPDIREVTLILGASIVRPQYVYQLVFSGGNFGSGNANKCTERKISDNIARKAIRVLISAGAGSSTYTGPSKLFLLVRSSSTFSLPLHFFPKRDFRFGKKVVPLKLHINCKIQARAMDDLHRTSLAGSSLCPNSTEYDAICYDKINLTLETECRGRS